MNNSQQTNDILEKSESKLPIIEVIGDSHLKPQGLSNKINKIIAHNHPGSTTDGLKRFSVPSIKKKWDAIAIHCGSNHITTNDDNITEKL